jgi:CubicO group peptidase (beta-lactamase class C family)
MAAGVAAKLACSGVFVAGRKLPDVVAKDIERVSSLTRDIHYDLDLENNTITATKQGVTRSALYRPGFGCTLVVDTDIDTLKKQVGATVYPAPSPRAGAWPAGDEVDLAKLPPEIDQAAMRQAIDGAFADDTPDKGIDTRAMIVVYDGKIVAERYAPGYGRDTRFLGWSASKSVLASLVGTLVTDGKLKLDDRAPVAEWQGKEDPRREITLAQLLQMSSGLAFNEPYLPGADSIVMLFQKGDMAAFAAAKKLANKPGTAWSYSSGTSNILARIVLQSVGGTPVAMQNYARQRLFGPAGMQSAVFEPDATGALVGSSYLYATARDWARFGLLYLNNGTIDNGTIDNGAIGGRAILSPDWVAFAQQRAASDPRGGYGAQFWLNGLANADSPVRKLSDLPADLYAARGHNHQAIAIIPSRKVVIVRLGWTSDSTKFDENRHFGAILAAIHSSKT